MANRNVMTNWSALDNSRLPILLRLDRWSTYKYLPVLFGVDIENSDLHSAWWLVLQENWTPHEVKRIVLYEDGLDLAAPLTETSRDADKLMAWLKKRHPDKIITKADIEIAISARQKALANIKVAHEILSIQSSPFKASKERPPIYFINWALEKNLEIPWLDWAKENGYFERELSGREDPASPANCEIDHVQELRTAAIRYAVKLVRHGMPRARITVVRICEDLLESGAFSNGEPFRTKWRTVNSLRKYLKGKDNPLGSREFLNAKPEPRNKFNSK